MSKPTIPILIDSIQRLEGFQRTRCVYFRIDIADAPVIKTERYQVSDKANIVLAMQGGWFALSGLIQSAIDQELFISSKSISETFQSIEKNEELNVDLSYIWLSNEWLSSPYPNGEIINGDVYRISLELFRRCCRFSAELVNEKEWLESCEKYKHDISYSQVETIAFREWRSQQIEQSRSRYKELKSAGLHLPKKRM